LFKEQEVVGADNLWR